MEGRENLPRTLLWAEFAVSLIATLFSLNFTGIGPLNWKGMGLFACELCWYPRILMYPLPIILLVGLLRHDPHVPYYVLPFGAAGIVIAAYHVFIPLNPASEVGQCLVGACSVVDYQFLDRFTIPQLSLLAFFSVLALTVSALLARKGPPRKV